MTYGSLCSGIGGIDLGLDRAGMTCKWQVEIDHFCRRILRRHWPEVKRYEDIHKVTEADLEPVDLICGGFPCTDLSQAGKRVGLTNQDGTPTRSGLWFEFARLIGKLRPRYVLIENVSGILIPRAMPRVLGDLARRGYVGFYRCLRASDFGASHLRKRVFIVAIRPALVPNAGGAGLPDAEREDLRRAGRGEEGRAATELRRTPLTFAPGPADRRWPAIIAESPDLSPSLCGFDRYVHLSRRSDLLPLGVECTPKTLGAALRAAMSKETTQLSVRGILDGLSVELDTAMRFRTKRLGRLGNSVVPEVAEWVGRRIMQYERVSR